MTHFDTIDFINGWRGFLVGLRRQWHAHQRFTLEGYRGGYVLAHGVQQLRLYQVTRLLREVLTRGASVWTYGLGRSSVHPWGNNSSHWRPGTLSNFFYLRLSRLKSYQPTIRVLTPASGRRGRPTRRLSVRWAHRRWAHRLPTRAYRGARRLYRYLGLTLAARSQSQQIIRRAVTGMFTAGVGSTRLHRRQGFRTTVLMSRVGRAFGPVLFQGGGRRGLNPLELSRLFAGGVFQRHHRRRRPVLATSRPRYQRWPIDFPGVTLGGGLTFLGTTLLNEVHLAGGPFVFVHGSDNSTSQVLYSVVWNQRSTSLVGFKWLITAVWQTSVYAGAFRVLWQRLAER